VLRWPGNLAHFAFLLIVAIVCGTIYGVARLGCWLFVWGSRRGPAVSRLRGFLLRQAMSSAGATFIKLGQVMSTRPDLFSPQVIDELRRLQDRLPPFAFRKARRVIEQDLGKPVDQLFRELDERPVAAASVAQVHRARLADGREVAIKVLRPGVRRQVERDRVMLIGLAHVIALHPQWRRSDPVNHTRHFVQAIHDQTDLQFEAENYTRFRRNFAGVPRVRFPEVYPELCSHRVLTMEFVRGTKIDALPPGRYYELAATVRATMFKMCFEDGFVHADLHPGNLMVQDGERLVIFDVGLAKLLHEDVLIQFIDITKCIAMGTPDDLVGHLQRFHQYLDGVDWERLRVEVTGFAKKFRAQDMAQLEYGQLISELFALGRRYHVRPIPDMMLVIVALITAQGIGKMLQPDHNVWGDLAQFLVPILIRRNEHVPDTPEARAATA
jgi:ubiquinone biosynthesis protein